MKTPAEHQNSQLAAIQSQLAGEISLVQRFLEILEQESGHLMQFTQPEILQQLSTQKAQAASALDSAYRHRMQLVQAALPTGQPQAQTLDALLLQLDPLQTGKLAQQWHYYNRHLSQARTLNENNGLMIHSYLKHNQEAIDALNRAAGVQHTYNHKGQRKAVASGKPLASG
ncbi:FlgN protein [Oligella ureolytica]|uniref:Flagellar protein FlgN n=1 Tax=Oligella ureolytica TaxID=90244 RepID=A0A378XHD3_9BURK|nr:flagellar protein FlgN [Oligella ureolytica]QPT39104.1 flagellar protein FlgN [Oligella ureolytica]SUA54811.1 FlgN protein [Oligella ureolytica]SUA55997.1 FlgN protein [Oligella ureolytica]